MNRFNEELYGVREGPISKRCSRAPLIPPVTHPEALYFPEGLSSYLTRAAANLSLTKTELIENYVLPRVSLSYSRRFLDSGRDAYSINSTGKVSIEFDNACRQLFSQFSHHEFSSFGFLEPLLGAKAKSVVSRYLKWCPYCLQGWRRNHLDIYYPLYWLAQDAMVCLKHSSRLEGKCPCCLEVPNVVTASSVLGYCNHCGEWLGKVRGSHRPLSSGAIWKAQAINQLVLCNHLVRTIDSLGNFRHFISSLMSKYGCASNIEKKLALSDSLIVRWRVRNRPKIAQLLDFCHKLNVYPHEILMAEADCSSLSGIPFSSQSMVGISPKRSEETLRSIRAKVENHLASTPTTSIAKLCQGVGVTSGFLHHQFPSIVEELGCCSIQETQARLDQRQFALYTAAIFILVTAYRANKTIGTHQLRELLNEYPGFSHLSMPAIRAFVLNDLVNVESRHLIELLPPSKDEKLLLHLKRRRNQDDDE